MKNFCNLIIMLMIIATTHSCGEVAEASTITNVEETTDIFESSNNQVTFRVDDFLGGDKIVVREVTINNHKYIVAAIVAGSTEGGTGISVIPSLSETSN